MVQSLRAADMTRPKKLIPMKRVCISLPVDMVAQLDLLLYSSIEGRIPYGKLGELIEELLRARLRRTTRNEKD